MARRRGFLSRIAEKASGRWVDVESTEALIARANLALEGRGVRLTFSTLDVAVVKKLVVDGEDILFFYLKSGLVVVVDTADGRVDIYRVAEEG